MKLAFLGGSFNPPHIGHLVLADEVCKAFGYDRILLIPANIPPHKTLSAGASAEDRVAMLRLAIGGNPCLDVDDREIRRGGVSYTCDTAAALIAEWGTQLDAPLALIIGDDLAADFSRWRRPEELAQRTTIILARRAHAEPCAFPYPHTSIANALLPVSSTDIRSRIQQKKSWRYLVPPAVYEYIIRNKLYGYTE